MHIALVSRYFKSRGSSLFFVLSMRMMKMVIRVFCVLMLKFGVSTECIQGSCIQGSVSSGWCLGWTHARACLPHLLRMQMCVDQKEESWVYCKCCHYIIHTLTNELLKTSSSILIFIEINNCQDKELCYFKFSPPNLWATHNRLCVTLQDTTVSILLFIQSNPARK